MDNYLLMEQLNNIQDVSNKSYERILSLLNIDKHDKHHFGGFRMFMDYLKDDNIDYEYSESSAIMDIHMYTNTYGRDAQNSYHHNTVQAVKINYGENNEYIYYIDLERQFVEIKTCIVISSKSATMPSLDSKSFPIEFSWNEMYEQITTVFNQFLNAENGKLEGNKLKFELHKEKLFAKYHF